MSQSQTDDEDGWALIPRWSLHGDYFESGVQKLLYIELADERDVYGYCSPSVFVLARDAMISPVSVLKNLKRLEDMGLIVRRLRTSADGGDEYYVPLFPIIEQNGL